MTIEDDIAVLERVPILRALGGGALRNLAIAAEARSLLAGEVLFKAGEASDGAYVLQRGSFNLRPERGTAEEIVAEPGTLFGEAALFTRTKRPATATAREPSAVLRIPRAAFLKVLDSYPEAAKRLRDLITSRADQWAREMQNVRAALARGNVPRGEG